MKVFGVPIIPYLLWNASKPKHIIYDEWLILRHSSRKVLIKCRVWYCFDVSHKLDNLKSIPFPCCEHSSTSWRPWYSAILINETSFALTYFRVFDDEKINNSYFLQNETNKSMKYLKYFYWVTLYSIFSIMSLL